MRDKTDFEKFYLDNYNKLYYFACQLVSDDEVCRDIVSDAFEYAWIEFNNPDVRDWKKYIYSFIRNKCVDYIRKQTVQGKYADFCQKIYAEGKEDIDYENFDKRIATMRKIIAGFTPQTRKIFLLCYVKGKKYAEVAEELGISTNAVKKHIMKALKQLRTGIPENDT